MVLIFAPGGVNEIESDRGLRKRRILESIQIMSYNQTFLVTQIRPNFKRAWILTHPDDTAILDHISINAFHRPSIKIT